MKANKKLRAIDLFCGCGGITSGLRSAGFEVLAGIDYEPKYIQTFRHNFPDTKALCVDITSLAPAKLMAELGIKRGELDLLAGGPPCQGFSKNVPRAAREAEAKNNQMVRAFLLFCEKLRPKWVVMENVAEMRNGFDQTFTNEIETRLQKAGYQVIHDVLNAADFGVPQKRRRAFFIARRDKIAPRHPEPTHFPQREKMAQAKQHVSVWEAISDLPSLKHGESMDPYKYKLSPQSDYQRDMRNPDGVVTNHTARKLQPVQYQRLASIKPGQGIKDLPDHLRPKSGYSGAYGRLTKEMVAPTITRWVFHPGSGRWGHPVDKRVLSIREVARIQGFPDSFEFIGSYCDQAGQLGNAVSPLLAQRLAESITAK
jgi:DNA (cytosine-5)-methyltransferase 1